MSCSTDLFIGNTNPVVLASVTDKFGDTTITDATVAFDLRTDYAPAGTSVASGAMTYNADVDEYRGEISASVSLTADATYIEDIMATKAGVGVGRWETKRVARHRTK